jgi:hypothetical protein
MCVDEHLTSTFLIKPASELEVLRASGTGTCVQVGPTTSSFKLCFQVALTALALAFQPESELEVHTKSFASVLPPQLHTQPSGPPLRLPTSTRATASSLGGPSSGSPRKRCAASATNTANACQCRSRSVTRAAPDRTRCSDTSSRACVQQCSGGACTMTLTTSIAVRITGALHTRESTPLTLRPSLSQPECRCAVGSSPRANAEKAPPLRLARQWWTPHW